MREAREANLARASDAQRESDLRAALMRRRAWLTAERALVDEQLDELDALRILRTPS
jgi:hypothetical protein